MTEQLEPAAAKVFAVNLCLRAYDARELPSLEVGAILHLPHDELVLTHGERVVGRGEVVEVDRQLGVRVVRLI